MGDLRAIADRIGVAAGPLPRHHAVIEVGPLETGDRAAWERLARDYKAFYRDPMPSEAYEVTWLRLRDGTELHGLGARIDGQLIGIAHYFFHPTFWSGEACYLDDLFVDEAVRGRGAARALIERVAQAARDRGATRYYWHTQDDNSRARVLYDRVARFNGSIRYQYPLLCSVPSRISRQVCFIISRGFPCWT